MLEPPLLHGYRSRYYYEVSANNTFQKIHFCLLFWPLPQWRDILQWSSLRSEIQLVVKWISHCEKQTIFKIGVTFWQMSFAQRASSFSLLKCSEINSRICGALSSWFTALSSTKNKQAFSKSFRSNVQRSCSDNKRWAGALIICRYSQIIANVRFGRYCLSGLRTFSVQ